GRPVEDVEDVLDGDREAVQRPAPLAAAQLVGQAFGLGAGVVAVDEHPGADALLAAVDALQAPFDEGGGRERCLAARLRRGRGGRGGGRGAAGGAAGGGRAGRRERV